MKFRLFLIMAALFFAGSGLAQEEGGQRFILLDRRIVRDARTGLEWRPAPDEDATWHEARRWAELAAMQEGRWRMPSMEELKTLHTPGLGPHNLSPLFQITAYTVWARDKKGDHSAWCFNIQSGSAAWAATFRNARKRAMAVRRHTSDRKRSFSPQAPPLAE